MNNFALEIWDDESRYVTFYTVRRENETDSETDKFYTRFKDAIGTIAMLWLMERLDGIALG